MARRKSYDLTESESVQEESSSSAGYEKKEATIQVKRHMIPDGKTEADWYPIAVQVSAEVNTEDASSYQNFEAVSEEIEGITLNDEEMDLAMQALGIEPVGDSMTEEEHDAALAADEEQEEV